MTKILLIDDDPDIQFVVGLLLESRGYQLRIEPDLKRGQQALMDFLPDLILLDNMLPDGKGIDFIQTLAHMNPVINVGMLTAKTGLALPDYPGKLELIKKPFTADNFLFAVNRLLA
jgi:DNA-binding response OmpR family regulator